MAGSPYSESDLTGSGESEPGKLDYAVLRLGAVINPINVMLTPEEVVFVTKDCGAKVLLASADQVAIDAVAARLMGFDPLADCRYIRLAHERGLGVGEVRQIELVGDDVSAENWHFEVGQSLHRFLAWLSWYGPTRVLQKLVFRTALVRVPILVSEVNHDYIHWPLKERKIYRRWREGTPWGRLFARYEKDGYLGEAARREPAGESLLSGGA